MGEHMKDIDASLVVGKPVVAASIGSKSKVGRVLTQPI